MAVAQRNRQIQQSRICAVAILCAAAFSGCRLPARPVRSTLPAPPTAAQLAELWVEPERRPRPVLGRRRQAARARSGRDATRSSRSSAAASAAATPRRSAASASGARSFRRKRRPRSSRRGSSGASATTSRRSTTWPSGHAEKAPSPNPQLPARFREKKPDLHGLDAASTWSYYQNPFVGTRQLNGPARAAGDARQLGSEGRSRTRSTRSKKPLEGADAGTSRATSGRRSAGPACSTRRAATSKVFEETPFIRGVENGTVRFDYRGRHKALFDDITPADVRWICERLAALTDEQWQDAFRAGGYRAPTRRPLHPPHEAEDRRRAWRSKD